jgi:hypothetical protein
VFGSHLSSLFFYLTTVSGAGLPTYMIDEVSWEPKKDERGPLIYYSFMLLLILAEQHQTEQSEDSSVYNRAISEGIKKNIIPKKHQLNKN